MARGIRYHARFLETLANQLQWLERHRPPEQRDNLRRALAVLEERVATFPGLAQEVRRRGPISYRVRLVEESLPYIVYYSFDSTDDTADVRLLMLLHERQDRARFDPSRFGDD